MTEVTNELIYKQGERILSELREMRVKISALKGEILGEMRGEFDELKREINYIHADIHDIKERLSKAHL
jgi:peptidoglycan hydrolase CwlO-like protein